MQQTHTWLKVSLFTKMLNWHYLLREIKLFISKNKHYVISYLIEFNSLCGDNIRLAILVPGGFAIEFVSVVDNHFKHFFLERNLRTEAVWLPVAGIFKPFDQNTIQYGLFDVPYSVSEAKLAANLSGIILTALKDDEIDDETLVTFAFYLHVAIFKLSKDDPGLSHEVGSYYTNAVSLTGGDINMEFLADKFESNKQDLADIYHDIMVENKSDLPGWLNDWTACIVDEMEISNANLTEGFKTKKQDRITSTVNMQLGLSRSSWLMIRYFLQQTINSYRKISPHA